MQKKCFRYQKTAATASLCLGSFFVVGLRSTQSTDEQYDSDVGVGESVAALGASQSMSALSLTDQFDECLLKEILSGISLLDYELPGPDKDEDQAPPVSGLAVLPHKILLEACERVATRLSVEWPAH